MKKLSIALLLALLALSACSDRDQPDDTVPAADPAETTAASTTAAVSEEIPGQPDVPAEETGVRLVSNAGNLTVETLKLDADGYYTLTLDEERKIFVLYDYLRDKDGNIWNDDNGRRVCTNIRAVLCNLAEGETEAVLPIDGSDAPQLISYTDTGCILYTYVHDVSGIAAVAAWELDLSAARLSLKPVRFDAADERSIYVTSPDGMWTAYRQSLDRGGDGEIVLRDSAGEESVILENTMLEEGADSIQSVEGYNLVGFLDNDRLIYNIYGWEWCKGWGIYHLKDGTKTEFREGVGVSAIHGGVLYGSDLDYAGVNAVYRMETDGTRTLLADESSALTAPIFAAPEVLAFGMQDGRWLGVPYGPEMELGNLLIYDAEMKTLLAEIEGAEYPWILYGDTLYLPTLE